MSDDLVSRLRDEAMRLSGQSIDRGCVDSGIGSNLADAAADALLEARAEIKRLRKVACDCASAIGNGAALSPESSLDFIELLPSEIAKHTDKLRRFLKCARDEGAEALARAEKAESALAEAVEVLRPLVARYEPRIPELDPDKYSNTIAELKTARRFIASQEPAEQEK